MSLLSSLKKTLRGEPGRPAAPQPAPPPEPDPDDLILPEIDPARLIAQIKDGGQLVILDCREPWERKQLRIPGSLHIPMNETPARLHELPSGQEIYVVCAHGNRSAGVSGYLLQQGFRAVNLRGGMAAWQTQGGPTESDYRPRTEA